MSKRTARAKPSAAAQLDFLSQLDEIEVPTAPTNEAASVGVDQDVKRWIGESIENSPMGRSAIAEAMTFLAGRPVSKSQLDTYTGAARPNRFPLDLLPAFSQATGNNLVFQRLAHLNGLTVADSQQAQLARLGQWALLMIQTNQNMAVIAEGLPTLPLFGGAR